MQHCALPLSRPRSQQWCLSDLARTATLSAKQGSPLGSTLNPATHGCPSLLQVTLTVALRSIDTEKLTSVSTYTYSAQSDFDR